MDETKDHEPRVDIVKVATVITTTSTSTCTETVTVTTEEIVEDESEKVGPEEGGDVMVEVLGSEVFVDGVTRHGGELGGDESGGGAEERESVGNGDGGGEMEDAGVKEEGGMGSGGVEDSVSEPCHGGGASGNGGSLPINDGVQEVEAHEKVVERNLGDEGGGTAVGLLGNSNELSEGSGPVRSDQIENGGRDSTSQVIPMACGTKDVDGEQSREPVENEGDGGDTGVVVHPPKALDLRSGEPLMSKEGDEQGMSRSNVQGIESVETTYMDGRSSCMESAECSSADLNPLGIENKVVVEEQMQDSSVQTQVKDAAILHKTGNEEVAVIDSVARDSETASPESSDMQTQVGTGEKNGNADSVNVLCTEPSLMAKDSDDMLCHRVNGQQLDVSNVRIDQETLKQSAGDQELLPERTAHGVLDKVVVNEETEREIDTGNDSELTTISSDKDVVSEDPEKSALLSGMDNISKATTLASKVPDNDEEVECCGDIQKLVTCSEVDQNMKTKTVILADMRSSDESSFSCRGEAGKMDMEVEDSVPKNDTLPSVKDEKPNDCSDSSDPSGQNNVLVGDKSGAATEMKDMDENAMEIDDATENPDCPENQKVDEKIICDGIEKNGNPQIECAVEDISVVGMDIDAVHASSEEQGKDCAVHQNDLMSNKDMVIENQESEAVLFTDSTIGTASADKNPTSAEGVSATPSLDSAKEVTVGCKSTLNSALSKSSVEPVSSCVAEFVDPGSGQSKNVPVQVGSMDIPSAIEKEKTSLSNPVTDAILGQEVTEAEQKIHKMDERLDNGLPVLETEAADVSISASVMADSDIGPKQDTHELSEGLAAHEQLPLPDRSLVKCVDQGPECEPDTSLGELSGTNATDGVAKVGSSVEESQVQEQAAVIYVPAAGSIKEDTNAFPRQDMYEEPEGHAAFDQSAMQNESLVNCVDGLESAHETSPGESLDKSATGGVPHVCSNVDEELNMSTTLEIEVPDILNAGSTVADLGAHPKEDGNEEFEGHAAHEQPFQDESFVQSANQGFECQPDTSVVEGLDRSASDNVVFDDTNMEDIHGVQEAALTEQVESPGEQEVDENPVSDSAKPRSKDEKNAKRGSAKPGSIVRDHRVAYQLPPENEGEFSVFDLVWGKVKSHPWWPGQIFHPSDSSEKAMKYFRKDCYLVAYFGDRSFAWNEALVLKPFRKHFSQEERQNNSESFRNAVNCALEEVSRRMELGLACSCISEDAYDKIKYQIVENAGIREESSKREGVDSSSGPDTLEPAKLLDYVRALAASASSGADRLDLVIAKAQLSAFYRLKGCDALPDFEYYEGLSDVDHSLPEEQGISCEGDRADSAAGGDGKTRSKGPHKRKHNLKDIVYQRRKEKSLTELMGETMYYLDGDFDSHEEDDFMLGSPTSGMKRKASDYPMEDFTAQQNTKTISFAKVSQTASPNPQQSFKVGECIRRVASQLTASPSIIKTASDGGNSKDLGDNANEVVDTPDDSLSESTMIPQKQSSPEDMLSQLHLSARDPMKGYSFFADIINFFSEFRNMAVTTQRQQMRKAGRKRKPSVPNVKTPETFEFDDRNDSYWTDMVIQNNSEVKTSRRGRKRKDDQLVSVDPEKPLQSKPRKYSRKQYFHGTHEAATEVPPGDEKKQDQLPTELMLNFSDVGSIPSEINLNKMFRRFGPLKESETEVDSQNSRARLVFKKRSDAEVAYSSAAMFNIFGSTLVNYQLNYTPSASFRTSTLALTDTVEHAT